MSKAIQEAIEARDNFYGREAFEEWLKKYPHLEREHDRRWNIEVGWRAATEHYRAEYMKVLARAAWAEQAEAEIKKSLTPTKRELFAAMAMQGLASNDVSAMYDKGACNAAIVARAVVLADALLAELAKEQQP